MGSGYMVGIPLDLIDEFNKALPSFKSEVLTKLLTGKRKRRPFFN